MSQDTENPVYPYPLRNSEFARSLDLSRIRPLDLSNEQKEDLVEFEIPLYQELAPLKKMSPDNFVIYPEAFTTVRGLRVFEATLLYPDIETELKGKSDKEVDDYFDNMYAASETEEKFEEYRRSRDFPRSGKLDSSQVKELFANLDLTKIPSRLRARLEKYSSQYAEDQFKEAFNKAFGEVERIKDPERIYRIVHPEVLETQIQGLRSFKRKLKEAKKNLGDSNLDLAKKEVIELYQVYTNYLIADTYSDKRIVDESITPRMMERVDHFLGGVGQGLKKDKSRQLRPTVPLRLARFSMKRLRSNEENLSEEYEKYNAIKVDAKTAAIMANAILRANGVTEWNVIVDTTRRNLSVAETSEGRVVNKVNIPSVFDKGLIDTLATLSHEIEGHVLRFVNRKNAMSSSLKIVSELGTGRSGILSEAASLKMEDVVTNSIGGVTFPSLPYYYLAIKRKQEGGSFKSVYRSILEARARRVYGMTLRELIDDKEKLESAQAKSFTVALRVFKGHTPLNDRSGYVAESENLNYIESELLTSFLESAGPDIRKILYVQGISLYSLESLIRLGALNMDKVREPGLAATTGLWPILKPALDSGKTIEEAVTLIQQ